MYSDYSLWNQYLNDKKEKAMTADEARKLNLEYANNLYFSPKEIDKKIRVAALAGKVAITLDLSKIDYGYRNIVYNKTKEEYEKKGFSVSRNTWSDPRGEDNGDNINISWSVK